MLDSDLSEDKQEEPGLKHQKKKCSARLLNAQTALQSIFYVQYLKPVDACQDPLAATSIFNDNSHLGKVFWGRFRVPIFNVRPPLPKV